MSENQINLSQVDPLLRSPRNKDIRGYSSSKITRLRYTNLTVSIPSKHLAEKRSAYTHTTHLQNVQEPITGANPEVRQIIERVLQAEKDKLYMKFPRNINDDVLKIIKEEIK